MGYSISRVRVHFIASDAARHIRASARMRNIARRAGNRRGKRGRISGRSGGRSRMHKPCCDSKSIDVLRWCLMAEQVNLFLGLYERLRQINSRHASRVLRQYRRNRPWLNMEIHADWYSYRLPGGCGSTGSFGQKVYVSHDILYGTMNLIRMIKLRSGEKSWDSWGWHEARQKKRLSGNCGAAASIIAGQIAGIRPADICGDDYSLKFLTDWVSEHPHNPTLREAIADIVARENETDT